MDLNNRRTGKDATKPRALGLLGHSDTVRNVIVNLLRCVHHLKSGVGPILSVVSVVASGIGRGLVVKSGNWSAGSVAVGREERDLSVGASGIQRGYSGDLTGIHTLFIQRVIFYPTKP